ncbi:hypothetical protein SAMN06265373_102701 [Shimia sagamensis]|uniref:Uncharacterized protein n=2 Tax=Shimia sagamensis TaxID=1566352 RepID=A0ABY1NP46_9RHOB|nr:hypothetical protein SAMN06265373_102701 [Shimia sagamensis]
MIWGSEEKTWGIIKMRKAKAIQRQDVDCAVAPEHTCSAAVIRFVFVVLASFCLIGGMSESQAQQSKGTMEFDIHRDGSQLHLGGAYQLPKKVVSLRAGVLYPRTGLPRLDENLTFGRFGIAWGATDRLQLSVGGNAHLHGPGTITNKYFGKTTLMSYSVGAKFKLVDRPRLKIGFAGTLDRLKWVERQAKKIIGVKFVPAGSAHIPITWSATSDLDLHVAPGISVMPSYIDAKIGAGTIVGANLGFTYVPSPLFSLYGSYNVPISGTNAISLKGNFEKVAIWTLGGRTNLGKGWALDLVATNGFGGSAATRIISYFPGSNATVVGVGVSKTFN